MFVRISTSISISRGIGIGNPILISMCISISSGSTSSSSSSSSRSSSSSSSSSTLVILFVLGLVSLKDGSIPRVVAGPHPPSVTNPCRAGFVSNLCRAALLYDGPCRASLVAKTDLCYKLGRARGALALLQSRRF